VCTIGQSFATVLSVFRTTNILAHDYWTFGMDKHLNGNMPGTAMNMFDKEMGWIIAMWKEAKLDRWIPSPTLVKICD
jgi:hypothetical protein